MKKHLLLCALLACALAHAYEYTLRCGDYDVRITARSSAPRFGRVTELVSGRTVAEDGNTPFSWRLGPGDLAVFEILTR